ncbi:hypothetical protein F8388_005191 [Cannabis sativa]|uniref:Ribosomal protein L2 C-terminal domain-containing protein n=1 Tax=Cannabis sativa TaxID=3483 RepID=A0A7J6DK93_CANSA|nr:hypothetical protein G4B88_009226 [Cannabis sativa]KAF4356099.1 hypothetical protein F8388_005191 [Cannabis sativa]
MKINFLDIQIRYHQLNGLIQSKQQRKGRISIRKGIKENEIQNTTAWRSGKAGDCKEKEESNPTNMPLGMAIHNIEITLGNGGQLAEQHVP